LILGRFTVVAILLFFLSTLPAQAGVFDAILKDFAPLDGYLVMPVGNEFLIDLDAGDGVAVGDLFTVVKGGEKVIHPVTGEVLGTLDQVKGVLQVTRVKSGYSYVRPLNQTGDLKPGDSIRRYENLQAVFWDYTGQGTPVYAHLKETLPRLEWLDYAVAQAGRPKTPSASSAKGEALFFVLNGTGLSVHGADYQVIHAYTGPDLPGEKPMAPAALPTQPMLPQATVPIAGVENPVKWDAAPGGASRGGDGYQMVFSGYDTLGELPESVMAVFTRQADQLLLACTDGKEIRVFKVADEAVPLAQGRTERPGQIIALHWWQPTVGGPLYLAVVSSVEENQAVTSATPQTISGAIFQLQDQRLLVVREGLPYLLGSFDRDGDGAHETLLGQNFDRDVFFGSELKEIQIQDGKVVTRRPDFELPGGFPVQGSLFADLTGDGRPETIFIRRRILSIYAGAQAMYESPQQMGGSLSGMTFTRNPGAVDQLFTTQPFEIQPVTADLDGDGHLELVAVASEGSALHLAGMGFSISKAWLSVLRYANGTFVRGRLGDDLENPIQGLAVDGNRVLLVSTQSGSVFSGKRRSHLLALPLRR